MATTSPTSLVIQQAIRSPNDQQTPSSLTFTPRVPDLSFMVSTRIWKSEEQVLPPRLPVTRTTFPLEHLELKLGSLLGSGRTGLVYEVIATNDEGGQLPPMVVKVARYWRQAWLAAEAWFYDELAAFQGVSIPRCYGWFEAELPEGYQPWYADAIANDKPQRAPKKKNLTKSHPCWNGKLRNFPIVSNKISLILMERLGDRLPLGEKLPENLEPELMEMFHELALCGVNYRDMRYANIRAALPSTQHPNLPSPISQHTYSWRICDLEDCDKSNRGMKWRDLDHESMLLRVLRSLPKGHIVEPWEW